LDGERERGAGPQSVHTHTYIYIYREKEREIVVVLITGIEDTAAERTMLAGFRKRGWPAAEVGAGGAGSNGLEGGAQG
jgi:hypothetical protein